MKLSLPPSRPNLRLSPNVVRLVILLAAGAAVILAIALLSRPGALPPPAPPATGAAPNAPAPADDGSPVPDKAEPGLVALDDFRVVVPPNWQRRKEMEDEGPGTKLFLVGPAMAGVNLVIGMDVYPLPGGAGEETLLEQYKKLWEGKPSLELREATLCNQPARMATFAENGQQKTFLLMVWRGKGIVVAMISPVGKRNQATKEFELVLDSFQVYD